MSERKTTPTDADVAAYLESVPDPGRREDARAVAQLMRDVTGAEPEMWGGSIIGFGRMRYTVTDGTHEYFAVGLAPRKAALTLYGLTYYGSNQELLDRLGKHTTGKGCLYIKKLEHVDASALRDLVARAWEANTSDGG